MTLVNITLTEEEQDFILREIGYSRDPRRLTITKKIRRAQEDVWEVPPVKIDTDGTVIDSGHARRAAVRPYPVKYSRGEE